MKALLKRLIILGILGGIGYFVCSKMCKKEDGSCGCGCKQTA